VAALAVPLVSGICTLCVVDALYVRKALLAGECVGGCQARFGRLDTPYKGI
jgi:hypothetical protein